MIKSIFLTYKKANKVSFTTFFFFIFLLPFLSFTSCKKTNNREVAQSKEVHPSIEIKKNHNWYYFENNSYIKIDKLTNVPVKSQKPWTEAIRISSANNTTNSTDIISKAYAVVNRVGIIAFEEDSISLSTDTNIFSDRTAGNLVFLNQTPIFSVYKSSFFNNTITDPDYIKNQSTHLFLIQFDDTTNISYPLLNCINITEEPNSEITDFYCDGLTWICSIKTISDIKNSFSYKKFTPTVSLLTLSPSTCKESLIIEDCTENEFRNAKQYNNYTDAPERIKSLLNGFDKKLPFVIEIKHAGGTSSRTYANLIPGTKEKDLQAKAILSQSWSAVLFEDGTMFLEGALPGKHILRGGKPVAIKLPKLPIGFVYSDFVISGTTLYVAWEETAFYKTGRSGFLQVNLEKTLFSKLI